MRLTPSSPTRRRLRRRGTAQLVCLGLVTGALVNVLLPSTSDAAGSPCGTNVNPIACENRQAGTPASQWDINGYGDATIQGFATDISVDAGSTINFKINTNARAYKIDLYRLGYYGGAGARFITSVTPSATLPQTQPACATNPSTSLYDCGTWRVSASWPVPVSAVSGVYLADLTRTDTGGMSQITFIVRNDASTSDVVYQTSDETWQAYNRYGGADFYTGDQQNLWDSPSRARALSYNRPFITRGDSSGRDFLFSNEYPTIRFLERNGYDVSYIAGVDTDRYGATLLQQHKVFMSVGHDEYWSQKQLTNVTNARDAGVNLMFLSGNEVYWHTRFAASIDGSNTAYRTLICYKETWDNSPTDPSSEATATFRDPRFSSAPGGGNPENSLTGTIFKANTIDASVTVTKAQGKLRIWRGTTLSSMSGSTTALAPHTVGYESDEDVDNGFRPAGLIDMSTSVGSTSDELMDFGSTTGTATTTHHITLYRASSGALVFGAGTVQWGWGIDGDHDGIESPADSRMQQATVNLLADMSTQPTTLMTGLAAATASTDAVAPAAVISSPAPGALIANGTNLTVTGTASDQGGTVAGVEVSLDGGATWHPATGYTSWSYTGIVHGAGSVKIEARATDDSANTQPTPTVANVTVSCPCSLFGNFVPGTTPGVGAGVTSPAVADSGDGGAYELGTAFTSSIDGAVTGIRFYKSSSNTGTHTGTLWSSTGAALATGTFTGETSSGWQTLKFATPVSISKNTTYLASYWDPNGHYANQANFFYYSPYAASPLQAPANTPSNQNANAFFATSHTFPDQSFSGSNYFVDVVFSDGGTAAPSVTAQSPAAGAAGVSTSVHPTATFSRAMNSASITFTLTDGSANTVAGATTYDAATNTATFTPSTALAAGTRYTATVNGSDTTGQALGAPVTWTFTTAFATGACPCTLFGSATPTEIDSTDGAAVTLGVKFTPEQSGYVTGVRFYKSAANTGTHTGTLWSSSGTALASVSFNGESASGWQTATFATPVAVTSGTTYVASYFAPNGHYSDDANFFTSPFTNGPLTAPAGSNGVYAYGSSATFPNSTFASTNYWVDLVFTTTAPSDTTPPTVTSTTPGAGSANVPSTITPSATFSEPVNPSSVSFTLADSSHAVAGTVAYDSASRTATFTPSAALATGTAYTASVSASDTAGNAMAAAKSWTFTVTGSCPCTLFPSTATPDVVDSGDPAAVTLGVRFVPAASGYITGVRFYKSTANTGTHRGTLWSSTGNSLATLTFTGESASGWQSASFAAPVAVTAGTTYVVSYNAPNGHYAATDGYFASTYSNGPLTAPAGTNGVYAYGTATSFPSSTYNDTNYWVDAVYTTTPPSDSTPPAISAVNASGTGTTATITWTTDEAATSRVDYGASSSSLTSNATAPGSTTSHSVALSGLTAGTTYYFRVTSADAAGNSATSPAAPAAPATYTASATPSSITDTAVADFAAGSTSSTYVATNGDGEVVLTPALAVEFSGTTLPSGVSSTNRTGGSSTVSNGTVTVQNADLTTSATYANGHSLEMIATLGRNQTVGWVTSSSRSVTMSFSVNASNQLVAAVNDGVGNNATSVAATGWTVAPHKFRIDWTSSAATFYVDDVQKYTHSFTSVYSNLRPQFSDTVRSDAGLVVDWFRVAPYAASGTFTSRVLDANAAVNWGALSWDAAVPTGTALTVKVRTGNTAAPDGTWTAYATIPMSGAQVSATSRYLQYQLTFTTSGSLFVSPAVRSVTVDAAGA